jgi:predicted AAA+ superfamily ATPase
MLGRRFADDLRGFLRRFPLVTVLGPRQCGKTTFIKQALPDWTYLDLERPSDAAPLAADPEGRLAQLGDHVVFDEAQRVPALFPLLRSVVDDRRSRVGRFVLLGSASPTLVREISESLAGRTALLDLPPLRWEEVAAARTAASLQKVWFRGGFPPALLARSDHGTAEWLEAYSRTIIERDLPSLGVEVSASQMRRLWTMLAHVHGGLWNASQLAAALGVSYHTINRYVDILEQTFLIRKLPPYFANVGKRLVKSPKVYFRDSGLLHWFLGIRSLRELDVHPSRGSSWEGFVVDQLVSALRRVLPASQAYFWRTAKGDEVDLLIEVGRRRIPFEIKLHSTPGTDDAVSLRRCMDVLSLPRGYLIYPGDEDYSLGRNVTALGASALLGHPERLLELSQAAVPR